MSSHCLWAVPEFTACFHEKSEFLHLFETKMPWNHVQMKAHTGGHTPIIWWGSKCWSLALLWGYCLPVLIVFATVWDTEACLLVERGRDLGLATPTKFSTFPIRRSLCHIFRPRLRDTIHIYSLSSDWECANSDFVKLTCPIWPCKYSTSKRLIFSSPCYYWSSHLDGCVALDLGL